MKQAWQTLESQLYHLATDAIEKFAVEHATVKLRCFFFDVDYPHDGHVSVAFDSIESNRKTAQQREQSAIENRKRNLFQEDAWKNAEYELNYRPLNLIAKNSADFFYTQYAEMDLPELKALAQSKDLPPREELQDDYMESKTRIACWRVIERLVDSRAFDSLQMASPFAVGYGLRDEGTILRLLNW